MKLPAVRMDSPCFSISEHPMSLGPEVVQGAAGHRLAITDAAGMIPAVGPFPQLFIQQGGGGLLDWIPGSIGIPCES
jgi:hypothetical protein